jgi:phenylalanyl-tRNA synthetase beta chain
MYMAFVDIEWLKDWVEIPAGLDATQLAADLVKVGLEEEEIHSSGVSGPIVLGVVKTMLPEVQKNGKTINYCRTDVGEFNDTETNPEEELEAGTRGIICGAGNFKVGDRVVVTLPGAVLPGGFEIAARKTYGHISNGMQASEAELGLGEGHDGIIVLQGSRFEEATKNLKPGDDLKDALGLSGELLEINITPDRGYCFAQRGVAREYALSTGAKFTDLVEIAGTAASKITVADNGDVLLEDEAPIHGVPGCSRFASRVVLDVDASAASPAWLVKRLESAGMRSISLPVDVTNYVMLHFGQPLHAYDLDQLKFPIVVRRAKQGEKIQTHDAKERELDTEDLLITDSEGGKAARAIGVAGVMGGYTTEVTETTKNIFLESAYFEPVTISRSARRHKLPSEASKRYERGIDNTMQEAALELAASLIAEYGGDAAHAGKEIYLRDFADAKAADLNPSGLDPAYAGKGEGEGSISAGSINFNYSEVARLLGIEVPEAEITRILEAIGCTVKRSAVTPPPWRPDLTIPAELVEEVARVWGYDKIPNI